MPYHRTAPSAYHPDPDLVRDLATELQQAPETESSEGASSYSSDPNTPTIQEEMTHRGILHVRVIWDRWAKLSPEERAQTIIEAYRRSQGDEAAKHINIAMGLTIREAIRFGFVA